MQQDNLSAPLDTPSRKRAADLARRYGVCERTARDYLRGMKAAGVVAKIRNVLIGRWSVMDAWLEAGGKAPIAKTRRSPTKVR